MAQHSPTDAVYHPAHAELAGHTLRNREHDELHLHATVSQPRSRTDTGERDADVREGEDTLREGMAAEASQGILAEGEATVGGELPDGGAAASLQLALSVAGGGTDSLALPLLDVASRETPTMGGGVARELSPLADVPDALSLGLSLGVAADLAEQADELGGGSEGAIARTREDQRVVTDEHCVASSQAPQLQTQIGAAEEGSPLSSEEAVAQREAAGAALDAVVLVVAASQRLKVQTAAPEFGPVLQTQLGGSEANAEPPHADEAPDALTCKVAEPLPPRLLLPAPVDIAGVDLQSAVALRDSPEETLSERGVQNYQVSSAAAASGDANAERGRSSSIAGTGALQADECGIDAPRYDSPCLAPAAETHPRNAANSLACAEAKPAAPTGKPDPRELADGRAYSPQASRDASVPVQEPDGLDRPANLPAPERPISAPQPDSIGDKTTDVGSSPGKQLHGSAAQPSQAADSKLTRTASPPAQTDAVLDGVASRSAADDAVPAGPAALPAGPAAEEPVSESDHAHGGLEGRNAWWAGGWEAASLAEPAGGEGDGGRADVSGSQPADGVAKQSMQPRSFCKAMRQVVRLPHRLA